jgi:hypothetical protein
MAHGWHFVSKFDASARVSPIISAASAAIQPLGGSIARWLRNRHRASPQNRVNLMKNQTC